MSRFVATINITVKKVETLATGQQVIRDAEMREANGEGSTPREAAEAAFEDGFERFIAGLPEVERVKPVLVTEGH